MAEIVSRSAALIAAGTKVLPSALGGKKRCVVITSPAAAAWADGDTVGAGFALPAGVRFTCNSFFSHADMGTAVVAQLGIRDFATQVAIDADGIGASLDVSAAAARTIANNGALVAAGVESVTTVPCEVYFSLTGAAATANAQIRAEVEYLSND